MVVIVKKLTAVLLTVVLLCLHCFATEEDALPAAALVNASIPCKSAILIEPTSGRILFEKDPDIKMPPASITKVMSLLLVMEALDSGKISIDDIVTASPHAISMGGSQIWLRENEQFSVHELLKAAAISSANDATVALGEHVAGSHDGFVAMMNKRAAELGMTNTTFVNATGLDAAGHLTTARDIATMSIELLKHPKILEYTTVWMDSLRNGATQLVNTNKLIRFYEGATGLKTGTTDGAGHCLSASATRNNLSLVAVVLGANTGDERFGAARGLLNYGFANYEMADMPPPDPGLSPLPVRMGNDDTVAILPKAPERVLVEKGISSPITQQQELAADITAPFIEGTQVGKVTLFRDGVVLTEYPLVTANAVDERTLRSSMGMFFDELLDMR